MKVCPACGTDVPDPSLPCPSCGRSRSLPGKSVFWILGVLGLLIVIVAIAVPGYIQARRASGERGSWASIKILATANSDFRSNDRDGNGVNDFWTGDVAGLYCISPVTVPPDPARSIKLIEVSIAGADSDPLRSPAVPSIASFVRSAPKAGAWYWAMRADASVSPPAPYRQDTKGKSAAGPYYNRDSFGFLAYPDGPSVGRSVYIINEGNTMYQRRVDPSPRPGPGTPPGPVTHPSLVDWPDAAAEKEWKRMD